MVQRNTVAIPRNRTKSAHPSSSSTDEARWQLVLAHTPTSEFLYGVLSTGIFCRTSCPSRRPRRANVRFFDSAPSAVAAGFRACRRCLPESTDSSHASPRASAEKQIKIACEYIRQRKGEAQLLDVAAHVGLSPRYFHGMFKQILGTTPGAYAAAIRRESSTPATSVRDPTPHVADLSHATDIVHLDSIGDGDFNMSFLDSDQITDDWLSECLADSMYTDQGSYSEWLNDNNLELSTFLEMDNGTLGQLIDTHASDCVDPSLLDL
ncbi:metal binding domain of Ada-domain-containing protein [Xylaria bambusicola]|uniref:metal binding domain of Ada-domain-containing protein n=1 Tax=Xylaria bambusicola TaxID=326684 RepID=UPI002008D62D|nr:metal binding domain of Ada-domain-containing protein [Xylaria bambusicola]KAI0518125.1 metal binding domain of Ada-domain-containing protein [Xylaria bambusicola]